MRAWSAKPASAAAAARLSPSRSMGERPVEPPGQTAAVRTGAEPAPALPGGSGRPRRPCENPTALGRAGGSPSDRRSALLRRLAHRLLGLPAQHRLAGRGGFVEAAARGQAGGGVEIRRVGPTWPARPVPAGRRRTGRGVLPASRSRSARSAWRRGRPAGNTSSSGGSPRPASPWRCPAWSRPSPSGTGRRTAPRACTGPGTTRSSRRPAAPAR